MQTDVCGNRPKQILVQQGTESNIFQKNDCTSIYKILP